MKRKDPHCKQTSTWSKHICELNNTAGEEFCHGCRMTCEAFMKLCSLIEPAIIRQTKHCVENGIVTPEVALHCAICWLSGCSWWSNCCIAGIVRTTFHGCCHRAIHAIISCQELCFHFPTTAHELHRAASDFQAISSHRVINGCVGALDSLLVKIVTQLRKEVANPGSFFSGHHHHVGINVQAACDAHQRFIHFNASHPGLTNDCIAHDHSNLPDILQQLPLGKFVVADNAFCATEHLLTPHSQDRKQKTLPRVLATFLSLNAESMSSVHLEGLLQSFRSCRSHSAVQPAQQHAHHLLLFHPPQLVHQLIQSSCSTEKE